MTDKRAESVKADSDLPFGSRPDRSKAPLVFLGVLYLIWLGVLLWMAVAHGGQ